MADNEVVDELRIARLAELNAEAAEREALEERYGQVWDTKQLSRDFTVLGFAAPYVIAICLKTYKRGSLEFQHAPRFYFNWVEEA